MKKVDCFYQVFLGPDQYFVSSDVGHGQQWYAFKAQEPGMVDEVEDRKPVCLHYHLTRHAIQCASVVLFFV